VSGAVVQIANALALASLLMILASGLALIYGLRDVMNFGHGGVYMLGAYIGYTVASVANFWAALFLTPLIMAVVGVALELLVLRPLVRRSPIELALLTFGLALILGQAIIGVYGASARTIDAPPALSGSIQILDSRYPTYRLFLIFIGFVTYLLLAAWLRYTRSGIYVRAISVRADVARMMGVDSDRLSLLVVCLSAASAGLAGVLAGPYLSIDPGMGQAILISCLIIVVIGGVGSIGGAILASLLYAFVQVIGAVVFPAIAVLVPYILLIGVLVWRPQGLGRGRV
jgi:branched-chain amino acid transport system permease protein